jgi:hypothetical protein
LPDLVLLVDSDDQLAEEVRFDSWPYSWAVERQDRRGSWFGNSVVNWLKR